jgi:hypothetical protein
MTAKQRSKEKCMTPEDARAALDRVSGVAKKAREELVNRQGELASLEKEAGTRMFNARLNSDANEEAKARAGLDAARQAIETAKGIVDASESAIKTAQKAVSAADAQVLRCDAEEIMAEVRPRLEHCREHLASIYEAEGVHVWPEPWKRKEGVFAAGSWARSATGKMIARIIELEREAIRLEAHTGIQSPPSVLAGNEFEVRWHIGYAGTITVAPLKGSKIDKASASFYGNVVPEAPEPSRDEIVSQQVSPRRIF